MRSCTVHQTQIPATGTALNHTSELDSNWILLSNPLNQNLSFDTRFFFFQSECAGTKTRALRANSWLTGGNDAELRGAARATQ